MRMRAIFTIVSAGTDPGTGEMIVKIIDDCESTGAMSVTNDAEAVVKHLFGKYGTCRIFYLDTMGQVDELRHEEGQFTGFVSGRGVTIP